MNTRTDELNEARALLGALEGCQLRTGSDRRFLESWRGYLDRTGDGAAIGRWRLQQLRKVAASYGVGNVSNEPETAQVDLLI
jgi:hypothetical protein